MLAILMKWGLKCVNQAVADEKTMPCHLVKNRLADRHLASKVTKEMLAILMKWGLNYVKQAIFDEKGPYHSVKNHLANRHLASTVTKDMLAN